MSITHTTFLDYSARISTLTYSREGIFISDFSFSNDEVEISEISVLTLGKEGVVDSLNALFEWDKLLTETFTPRSAAEIYKTEEFEEEIKKEFVEGGFIISSKCEIDQNKLTDMQYNSVEKEAVFQARDGCILKFLEGWKFWVNFYQRVKQQIVFN